MYSHLLPERSLQSAFGFGQDKHIDSCQGVPGIELLISIDACIESRNHRKEPRMITESNIRMIMYFQYLMKKEVVTKWRV